MVSLKKNISNKSFNKEKNIQNKLNIKYAKENTS